MIYCFIPYLEKNLGKAYNNYMRLIPNDDDWAYLLDHDVCFTTYHWYNQLLAVIEKYGNECKFFVPIYNRIGCKKQQSFAENSEEWFCEDMDFHRNYGQKLYELEGNNCEDITWFDKNNFVSGVGLIQKSLWKKVKEFVDQQMITAVDNDFMMKVRKINEKVYLMKGLYLYHWYRGGDRKNKKHLII